MTEKVLRRMQVLLKGLRSVTENAVTVSHKNGATLIFCNKFGKFRPDFTGHQRMQSSVLAVVEMSVRLYAVRHTLAR